MKKKLALFLLITIIAVSPIIFLSLNSAPIIHTDIDSEIDEEKEKNEVVLNPETSSPDWVTIDKPTPFVAGTQDNPWNETNLKNNDGLMDSTNFAQGDSYSLLRDTCSPCTVPSYTGVFGSTDGPTNGGDWWFTDAYKDNDGIYFYLEATRGFLLNPTEYPDWIHMTWGEYGSIPATINPHVYSISIDYEVWATSSPGILDESTDLRIWAWSDNGLAQFHTIAATPADRNHYEDTWTITSGLVFNRVKAGGYIKHMSVQMYCNEEWATFTWIFIDYVDINYNYHKFKVDFGYVLDFGTSDLDSVSEFELQIDMGETVFLTAAYLYDYDLSLWYYVGLVQTAGLKTFLINLDADHYFNSTGEMILRISRYAYHDGRPSTDYQIKVDMVKVNIPPPDPPPSVEVDQGILHVFLTWDTPEDYGVPIIHYNVYRGEVQGGVKTLIGTPSVNEFNDTTGTLGVRYYYNISATNTVGEGGNSTEVSGKSFDQPFVEWLEPNDSDTIIFPYNITDQPGNWIMFNFKYDWAELDDVKLFINGSAYGSVWEKNSSRINPYLDGPVTAVLKGYNNSIELASDTISLTFVRIEFEIEQMLDFGTEIHGGKLYMILHDPHGDGSYSSYTETTTLSIGFGYEITDTEIEKVSIGMSYNLFGIELGASTETTTTETQEEGFDFRLERSDTTTLTSNQNDDNPDYIGPGYGDVYWGESWIYKWALNATWREYSNGTDVHEEPKLFYGIIRGVETVTNDMYAPQEWKDQNPVHNNWEDTIWIRPLNHYGDIPYEAVHEVTGTVTRTHTFTVDVESAAAVSAGLAGEIIIAETSKNYVEGSVSQKLETSYYIFDDEETDMIAQGLGLDKRFGTFIFNSSSFFCETSYPLEHNTFDYLPPIVEFPDIDYDSNDDLQEPCYDDSPTITVDIFDEGGIQEALLRYSIDNGSNWDFVYLTEDINFPGTWSASIPVQEVDTEVQWYIICWDYQGSNSTKKNGTGEPFKYTVVNKITSPSDIPGYPLMLIASFSIIAFVSIIIVFHKKRRKFYQ